MSRPVKIITDSTSDIPGYIATELGIGVVPLSVIFGSRAFLDGVDISINDFYEMLLDSHEMPTTAAPSPGQFLDEFNKAESQDKDVISIHISRKLSATYDVALSAKEKSKTRVEVVDSQTTTMGLGLLAIWAAKKSCEGIAFEELLKRVEEIKSRVQVFGVLDTLDYLQKGGRIGRVQAFLGSILNIKPILCVRNGEAFPVERVRTKSKALDKLWELCQADMPFEELSVLHSTAPEEAEVLLKRLSAKYPGDRIYKARFGTVLGTHLGPGSLGVAYIKGK